MNSIKIGVLTYHKAHNYGAYLQSFALTSFLRKLGYDCEIIDYNMEKAERTYMPKKDENYEYNLKKYQMFKESLKLLPLSNFSIIDDNANMICDKISNTYDVVIVGSDEVWKTDGFRGFPNPYWLPEKISSKKIGYAISSRSDFSKLKEEIETLKKYINEFEYIGLRDEYSILQVSKYCSSIEKINHNCDPTFLYDFNANSDNGKKILKETYSIDTNKKTILIMTNNKILVQIILKLFGRKNNIVSIFYSHKGTINTPELNPFELLDVIKYSDILITSFFHGVCFAIQNNTNFIADDFREKSKKQSKIYDLLKREKLLNHFISKHNLLYFLKVILKCRALLNKSKPNYSDIVENERKISQSFFEYLEKVTKETKDEEGN